MPAAQGATLRLKGIAASPGIAIARAAVHHPFIAPAAPQKIPAGHAERHVRIFEEALAKTEAELKSLQSKVRESIDEAHASIFDPHLLFLHDPAFKAAVAARIRTSSEGPHYAVMGVVNDFAQQFARLNDAYIASRASDIYDVAKRICRNLTPGGDGGARNAFEFDVVLCAHDLTPSDTAQMDHSRVKGFATEVGGPTSHTAILAKALEIPAVVGLGSLMQRIGRETTVIIDGYEGVLTLNPTDEEIKKARAQRRRRQTRERDYRKLNTLPAETIDGYRVELSANIELPSEIAHVKDCGGQGIGLFRTEFLFLRDGGAPTEAAQFDVYREAVEQAAPGTVIFRTLDLGGDKLLAGALHESNPFLGLRAIRYCLKQPSIFLPQLRALLRASAFGAARIMFPMVSSAAEVAEAKKMLETAKEQLRAEGQAFDEKIEIGVMIEIPSAAVIANELAREVDFFSIGTNDLIQYTLAVDRTNERVASLYDPFHPAVLRLIRETIDAAHRAGIWVGVCGEMAGAPVSALMLVGMGIDELSMGPFSIPEIKYLLRHVRLSEARRLAGEIMGLSTSEEIRRLAERVYGELVKRRLKQPIEKK